MSHDVIFDFTFPLHNITILEILLSWIIFFRNGHNSELSNEDTLTRMLKHFPWKDLTLNKLS